MDFKERAVGITAITVDPGVVATRLNGWKNKVDLRDSVRGIYTVTNQIKPESTGSFWSWNGINIPY